MRKYSNISKLTDLLNVFQEKDLDWFWINMFVVLYAESDKKDKISEQALIFIEAYKDLFGIRGSFKLRGYVSKTRKMISAIYRRF